MTISLPEPLKREMERHPEVNWSAVASKAFQRQLRAQKILDQFSGPGVTEDEAIKRGLQLRHPEKVVEKVT